MGLSRTMMLLDNGRYCSIPDAQIWSFPHCFGSTVAAPSSYRFLPISYHRLPLLVVIIAHFALFHSIIIDQKTFLFFFSNFFFIKVRMANHFICGGINMFSICYVVFLVFPHSRLVFVPLVSGLSR